MFPPANALSNYIRLRSLPLGTRGVDAVLRARYAHKLDWRRGRCLGKGDRLVTMKKPVAPSRVMSRRLWQRLPEHLPLRQVRGELRRKGWRTETLVLTTSLLDATQWPRGDPAGPLHPALAGGSVL